MLRRGDGCWNPRIGSDYPSQIVRPSRRGSLAPSRRFVWIGVFAFIASGWLAMGVASAFTTTNYSGDTEFTVPPGVLGVEVTAVGAHGGGGCAAGGRGALVRGT